MHATEGAEPDKSTLSQVRTRGRGWERTRPCMKPPHSPLKHRTGRVDDLSMDAVCALGLRKCFGEKVAVDGIDLRVRRGSWFGVVGPNGAGKIGSAHV